MRVGVQRRRLIGADGCRVDGRAPLEAINGALRIECDVEPTPCPDRLGRIQNYIRARAEAPAPTPNADSARALRRFTPSHHQGVSSQRAIENAAASHLTANQCKRSGEEAHNQQNHGRSARRVGEERRAAASWKPGRRRTIGRSVRSLFDAFGGCGRGEEGASDPACSHCASASAIDKPRLVGNTVSLVTTIFAKNGVRLGKRSVADSSAECGNHTAIDPELHADITRSRDRIE